VTALLPSAIAAKFSRGLFISPLATGDGSARKGRGIDGSWRRSLVRPGPLGWKPEDTRSTRIALAFYKLLTINLLPFASITSVEFLQSGESPLGPMWVISAARITELVAARYGALPATTPMLATVSPFFIEGTAQTYRTTPLDGARASHTILPNRSVT